jgi:hypothetical protein
MQKCSRHDRHTPPCELLLLLVGGFSSSHVDQLASAPCLYQQRAGDGHRSAPVRLRQRIEMQEVVLHRRRHHDPWWERELPMLYGLDSGASYNTPERHQAGSSARCPQVHRCTEHVTTMRQDSP